MAAAEKGGWLQRFILWREKNVKEKRFILILSFLVGIFTAFAALILKVLIHWIQNFDGELQLYESQLPISGISGSRHFLGWIVCTLCGER